MPHQRTRAITNLLIKKLKLWPVVGVVGPRQCGKSTLLREILPQTIETDYVTMDSENLRSRAEKSPESFTEPVLKKVKIIDEVQKVPALFDAVKLHVDQKRRPGTYILSGSTQFSQLAGVRESLTGRIGILQLYPFNLSEIYSRTFGKYFLKKSEQKSQISLNEFDKKIERGGMPGFFFLHSNEEYASSAQLWIETTCFRDLGRILKKNFDPELALSVLTELAQADTPTATEVGRKLGKDSRIISRYLDGFVEILVLKKLEPHAKGVGKPHFLIVDSGLATYLGASRETALRSHVLVEALSYFEASGLARPQLMYYQSEKKSFVPLVFFWRNERRLLNVQISDRENPSLGEVKSIESFVKRLDDPKLKIRSIVLNQAPKSYDEGAVEFYPIRG